MITREPAGLPDPVPAGKILEAPGRAADECPAMFRDRPVFCFLLFMLLTFYFIRIGLWVEENRETAKHHWDHWFNPAKMVKRSVP